MGYLRFRRSVKILPGVRVNFNKSSTSVTFGGKGFKKTVSSTGRVTNTVGIPGTGISYTEVERKASRHTLASVEKQKDQDIGISIKNLLIVSFLIIILMTVIVGLLQ